MLITCFIIIFLISFGQIFSIFIHGIGLNKIKAPITLTQEQVEKTKQSVFVAKCIWIVQTLCYIGILYALHN